MSLVNAPDGALIWESEIGMVTRDGYSSEHEARVDVQRYIMRYNNGGLCSDKDCRWPVAMEKLAA